MRSLALRTAVAVGAVLLLVFGLVRHWGDDRSVPDPIAPSVAADPRWFGDGQPWDQSEAGRTVLVVGDSLSGQFGGPLEALAAQRAQHWEVWGLSGGAPCDVMPDYGAHILAMDPPPSRIALEFVGNVGNRHLGTADCMVSRLWPGADRSPATLTEDDRARIAALYRQDLTVLINWDLAHNMQTVLVNPPEMQGGTYFNQVNANLITAYDALGSQFGGVWSTYAVRETLTPGGTWRAALTAPDGTYQLRQPAPDGAHLHAPYGTQMYAGALFAALSVP
jgi:hypothetical protein